MQPVSIFTQMPSCAPSAPGLETTGLRDRPRGRGRGDGLARHRRPGRDDELPRRRCAGDPQDAGRDGRDHARGQDRRRPLRLARPWHRLPRLRRRRRRPTTTRARARRTPSPACGRGWRSMLRLGSAWYDVEAQITAITEKGLDPRNFILCTDDCHSGTLVHDGHMDRVVRHAIACGCDPLVAIQMATLNTATHFGLAARAGLHRAGPAGRPDPDRRPARRCPSRRCWRGASRSPRTASCLVECPHYDWPAAARQTVRLGRRLEPGDFAVPAPDGREPGAREGHRRGREPGADQGADRRPARRGRRSWMPEGEVAHIALVERHRATGGGHQRLRLGLRLPGAAWRSPPPSRTTATT